MDQIVHLTTADFDQTILKDMPVFVDFWATWCGPCRMITPFIEQLAEEFQGKAVVCKVNVDEETDLAERFGIQTIPTVLLFRKGELLDKSVGAKTKQAFEDMLTKAL